MGDLCQMKDKMLLSIVIPVFNGEKYLKKCLDSIFSQKKQVEFEVIVVDDASVDKTSFILEGFQEKYPNEIKVFHNLENQGVSIARNIGLEAAVGIYVAFVDADDLLTNNYFEYIDEKEDCDLVLFDMLKFKNEKEIKFRKGEGNIVEYGEEEGEVLIKAVLTDTGLPGKSKVNLASPCAKLYRRKFIEHYNLRFLEDVKIGEDMLFNVQVMAYQKKMKYISETVYCYRQHSKSAMHGYNEIFIEEDKKFSLNLSKILEDLEVSEEIGELIYRNALGGLVQCLRRQIFSEESKLTQKEKYALIDNIIIQEPYRTAIRKCRNIELKWKQRMIVWMLRKRWYGAIAFLVQKCE